ncbi:MAG: DUF3822 family protein, partial [Ginsengibacter sp.]
VLKPVFEIIPGDINTTGCELLCEVSNEGFSYLINKSGENNCLGAGVYHFSAPTHGHHIIELQKIFETQDLFEKEFNTVSIIYSFPESVMIPFSLYNSHKNAEVLNMMHGDFTDNDLILTDMILDRQVYNCYRLPSEVVREISNRFPSSRGLHQYTALLQNMAADANGISVIFYPQKIVLTAAKEGQVLLINCFSYKSPEDVSYIILNVCKQLNLENIPLAVSGLIEKDSALYKEIYKYFDQVHFATTPPGYHFSVEMTQYPPHYFGHLFAKDS